MNIQPHVEGPKAVLTKTRGRVLVVDDEPGILDLFKLVLGRYDFAGEVARNAAEALARLETGSFDVVVSDVNMPGMSGLDLLRAVRARDLDVPVILMTGKPTVEASAQALEHGAFRYLLKPLMPATLLEAIERAMNLREVARLKRAAIELGQAESAKLGDRAALEARFAGGLAGLWMAFQPIVCVSERRAYGYEALLRTTEPSLANPAIFLDAAERLARLPELGRAIRARAAKAVLPDGASLFVNLHATDLNDEELYTRESPLAAVAERVVLEITERATLDVVDNVPRRVADLRRMGFRIAVDDLGAGYAGLASFTLLEPEVAKLDMSLVRDISNQPRKQSIVRSLRRLCDDLRVEVVAEGVETVAERDTLVSLGCDLLQGYLFGRPEAEIAAPKL